MSNKTINHDFNSRHLAALKEMDVVLWAEIVLCWHDNTDDDRHQIIGSALYMLERGNHIITARPSHPLQALGWDAQGHQCDYEEAARALEQGVSKDKLPVRLHEHYENAAITRSLCEFWSNFSQYGI